MNMAQERSEFANIAPDNPWLHHPQLGEVARNHVIPGEHCYDGIWYPAANPASSLEAMKTFEFRDDDVILMTYIKSGTPMLSITK